jgi:alpha-glucosidase
VSGVSFSGVDVGGFNADATAALYARWITLGAFTPFFRAHKAINYKDAEPWSYGEQTEEIAKKYISLRYQLLPYLYSAIYASHSTGIPVNRTLAINYPFDKHVYDSKFQNEFLFGESILVAPLKSTEMFTAVYFPKGGWYDLYNDNYYKDGQTIVEAPLYRLPVFAKAGSIIPMQSIAQSTSEKVSDTLFLHLYTGADNQYLYYEDDGNSYDYNSGNYYQRNYMYTEQDHQLQISKPEGTYPSKFKYIKIFIHSKDGISLHAIVNNERKTMQTESYSLMGNFILNYVKAETTQLGTIIISNSNSEINVSW